MIRSIFPLTGAAVLLASGAVAATGLDAALLEKEASLRTAIVANGCEVNDQNNLQIIEASGVSPEDASKIAEYWITEGKAVPNGPILKIITEGCN